jgi:hypothetical protein
LEAYILGEYKPPTIIANYKNITPHIRYIAGELQISTSEGEGAQSFPAIAAHVTSYARMLLFNYIKHCKKAELNVYYCDTDSIFTSGELLADFISSTELGKLKLEHCYDNGLSFMGLKNYSEIDSEGKIIVTNENKDTIILEDGIFLNDSKIVKGEHWKLKGVKNDAVMIDKNVFIQQEWSGLPKQQYYEKFGKPKGEYWIIYVTKKTEGDIKKGNLSESGEISPFNLSEF